VTQKNLNQ